jgi:hypothetical protein
MVYRATALETLIADGWKIASVHRDRWADPPSLLLHLVRPQGLLKILSVRNDSRLRSLLCTLEVPGIS